MYDRTKLEAIPTVFSDILDEEALDTGNFAETMTDLLAQIHGLAGVCVGATRDDVTCWQDLGQALGVLHGYTEAASEFFTRWREAQPPGPPLGACLPCGPQGPD